MYTYATTRLRAGRVEWFCCPVGCGVGFFEIGHLAGPRIRACPSRARGIATRCIKMSPRYPQTSQDAPSLPQDAPKIMYPTGPSFLRRNHRWFLEEFWRIFGTFLPYPKLVLSPERRQFCNFLNDKSRVKRGGGHAAQRRSGLHKTLLTYKRIENVIEL